MIRVSLVLLVISCMFITYSDLAEERTSTQMFCAYGNLFVEFKDGNHIWGSLWLDRNGRPVPCKEGDTVFESNYKKEDYDKSI